MSRTNRAIRSAAVLSVLGYAAQGLSLLAIPLFLRTVGAEGYGLMVTVMAFMGYLGFADAGLSWGAMILIAQAEGKGDRRHIAHIVRHGAVLALGSGLVAMLALAAILGAAHAGWRLPMFAANPEADLLLLIAGGQLILNLQFGIVYNLFYGLQEGFWAGAYQGGGRLLGLAGAMGVAWYSHSVAGMLLVQVGANVLLGVAALCHAWRRHAWAFQRGPWTDRAQYVTQLRVGAKNLLLQVGRTLSGTAPTLAISSILGPAAVPFYTVPISLLSLFFAPIASWNASLQSAYGEAWAAGEKDWVRATFRLTLERALVIGGLGVALFLALGNGFIRWWTHDRIWLDPAVAFSVAAVLLLAAWLGAMQFLLTGLNRHRRAAIAEIANGVLALALVAQAIRWWGLPGIGPGMVAAAALTSIWVLRGEINFQLGAGCLPRWGFALKVAATAAATTTVAALTLLAWHERGPVGVDLATASLTGLTAFVALALGFRLFALSEARGWLRRLRQKISPLSP